MCLFKSDSVRAAEPEFGPALPLVALPHLAKDQQWERCGHNPYSYLSIQVV
jgi:hypothetical protein